MKPLTAIDLCCGAGGWQIAARGLPIRFVAAVDWAYDCCRTVRYNHPDVPVVCADVRSFVTTSKLPGIDLLLGAVPCEEISVARASRPASEDSMRQWHELLDAICGAADSMAPKWWAVENVVPMRRHLFPLTPHVTLNSKGWSGQSRSRLFLGNFPVPKPITPGGLNLGSYLQPGPYIVTERILGSRLKTRRMWYSEGAKRVLTPDRAAPTITDFGSRHSRGFVVQMPDERERVLQFTEAARLQGFPDDYVFVGSQSRAWKMVAQAIQIDLGRAILEAIVAEASTPATAGRAARSRRVRPSGKQPREALAPASS